MTPELQKSIAFSAASASRLSTIFSSIAVAHDQPAVGRRIAARRSPARRPRPWPCGRPATRRCRVAVVMSGASAKTTSTGPRWPLSAGSAALAACPVPSGLRWTTVGCGREGRGHVPGARRHHADDPGGLQPARHCPAHGAPSASRPADAGPSAAPTSCACRPRRPAPPRRWAISCPSDATGLAVPQGGCAKESACIPMPTISSPAASTP